MLCKLCRIREATKKNTHYLTDGIIKNCLNLEGSNIRESGFYFNFSNDSPFVEYGFQRTTSVSKLEIELGRPPTVEEMEKAKQNPYSVDYVFCPECEAIFTETENKFIKDILPKFRNSDSRNKSDIDISNVDLLRRFFYIQIWRTSVCDTDFIINDQIKEDLRQIILRNISEGIRKYPLSITYLETIGGVLEYTNNFVGYSGDINTNYIFMNDLCVQFFGSKSSIAYQPLYGVNEIEKFKNFINYEEDNFKVKIIHDEKRKLILHNLFEEEKVEKTLFNFDATFVAAWVRDFNTEPSIQLRKEFIY